MSSSFAVLHSETKEQTQQALKIKQAENEQFKTSLELRRPICIQQLFDQITKDAVDKIKKAASDGFYSCTLFEYDYPFKHNLTRPAQNEFVNEFHTVYLLKGANGEQPDWCVLKRLQEHFAPFNVYDVFHSYERPNVIKICWYD